MENTDKIWILIARVLNNEAGEMDREELNRVLNEDESLQQQFDLLSRIWKERKGNFHYEDPEAARNKISRIINKTKPATASARPVIRLLFTKRVWLSAAACLVLAVSLWTISALQKKNKGREESLEARRGTRSSTLLPDGTTVWLNAGSRLYYSEDVFSNTREVKLEGEAFFDVVKKEGSPFIVHTSGISIKVLGTAFNVKAYPDDKTFETTLYRGLIEVIREDDPSKTIIQLRPNEKLTLNRLEAANDAGNLVEENNAVTEKKSLPGFISIAHIDSTRKESERLETAWLYSRLEFRGDNFEELAKKLERWYNIKIVFTDEKVKQLSFNGSFEQETIGQAFKYLKEANDFDYQIINNEIYAGSTK